MAGGLGTRLSEETSTKPKPMVEIGGKPVLWHIMKLYSYHGINEFIICCGYKGYLIKEYFSNYYLHNSDLTVDLQQNTVTHISKRAEPWKVTLIDTGDGSMTGGRLLRLNDLLKNEESFCFTYGDGVGNVDIQESLKFHDRHKKLATMTTCFPPGRFGALNIDGDYITNFQEKPEGDGSRVNAGFFVLSPGIFEYLEDDFTIWEKDPLQNLAIDRQLMSFKHDGFWQPMDTLFDKNLLQNLWEKDSAPWKVWT